MERVCAHLWLSVGQCSEEQFLTKIGVLNATFLTELMNCSNKRPFRGYKIKI